MLTTREKELQIEIERLKAWLHHISVSAYCGATTSKLEEKADKAIAYSHCACHPDWSEVKTWPKLGIWP